MKRLIGYLALILSAIGLAGCLAGLVVIWMARPSVLQSSAELLDAADDGLRLVEEKTKRADELVDGIRSSVDPVASKILQLADKSDRTPQEDKELKRVKEKLTERLRQADAMVEAAETAVGIMNKTARLASSVRPAASRILTGSAPDEDSQESSKSLARLATKLKNLAEILAMLREDKQVQKDVVDHVVRVTRDVDDELKLVAANLQRVRQKTTEWQTEVADLRTSLPVWTHSAVIIGSLILAWVGLSRLVFMGRAWIWSRPDGWQGK
jgi:methyl-accepting chemotaxis protein